MTETLSRNSPLDPIYTWLFFVVCPFGNYALEKLTDVLTMCFNSYDSLESHLDG